VKDISNQLDCNGDNSYEDNVVAYRNSNWSLGNSATKKAFKLRWLNVRYNSNKDIGWINENGWLIMREYEIDTIDSSGQ
jgi:hypothetical protein